MKKLINPVVVIIIAVVIRLLPHPPNVAPIAAMALFGGVYLNKKYALIVPILTLFLSDLFLGLHNTIPFVYVSFLITGVIGLWLKKHKSIRCIIIGTLLSSTLFFLITNFGVWLVENVYTKNFAGLLESFTLAIPFFRNTIAGDLIYTGLFFGVYEFALRIIRNPIVKLTS